MFRTPTSSLVLAFALSGALGALTGCPGKLEGGPGGTSETCKNYAAARAAYNDRCEVPGQGSQTPDRLEEECAKEIVAPGAKNRAAMLDRCTSDLSTASCRDRLRCGGDLPTGDLADGAACGEGFQCKSGFCRRASIASCGVCVAREGRSGVGGACVDSAECVEGASCVVYRDGGKCIAFGVSGAGGPCGTSGNTMVDCENGLRCLATASTERGTCSAPIGPGGDCRSMADCTDGLTCIDARCVTRLAEGAPCDPGVRLPCAKGLACDGSCKKIIDAQLGEACDAFTRVCERGICKGGSETSGPNGEVITPGTCVLDRLQDGEACDDSDPLACQPPAVCIEGTCAIRDPGRCK